MSKKDLALVLSGDNGQFPISSIAKKAWNCAEIGMYLFAIYWPIESVVYVGRPPSTIKLGKQSVWVQ